jgi:hypothetical protein
MQKLRYSYPIQLLSQKSKLRNYFGKEDPINKLLEFKDAKGAV